MTQEGRQNQEPLGKIKVGEVLRNMETSREMASEVGREGTWTET